MVFRSSNVSSRGFTLMELMVVVAIIAFVTAATIPSFSRALLENRQRLAGAILVEAVLNARSLAARTGRCHRVRVFPSTPSISGGNGGRVEVQVFNQSTCMLGANPADWARVSIKAIGRGAADPDGISNAPLEEIVGDDVAILTASTLVSGNWFVIINPNGDEMQFEPTGELFGLQNRSYAIQMYLPNGTAVTGNNSTKFVNVMAGGLVRYDTDRR
jgi:prepilin-type N-terminal cleavage/methylation domain-containing protein